MLGSFFYAYLSYLIQDEQAIIFAFSACSVDDGFPPVTFHFGSSLHLKVYPRDYLFPFVSMLWQ